MIETMLAQDGVRLPGDRRHQHRISAKRAGVWIDPHNYDKLNGYCRINGSGIAQTFAIGENEVLLCLPFIDVQRVGEQQILHAR